jgi:Protein of unknown function (DUF2924)
MTTTHADVRVIADAEPKIKRADEFSAAKNVATRLKALEQMDHASLRAEWRRLYRANPPKHVKRNLLLLAVTWKIQEQAFGGLAAATRRRLADLAETLERDGDVTRSRVARLRPGAKLVREWHGKTHTVIVCEEGFEWKGRHWRSLSVIAREITGGHWSGPRFFGLNEKARSSSEDEVAETADA